MYKIHILNNKISIRLENFLLVTLLFISFLSKVHSQVKVYSFSQNLVGYTPLTGTPTVAYASPWDDHVAGSAVQVTMPFTFTFDGLPQTQFFISPNGFITFGTTQPNSANYAPIVNATAHTGVISALGVNLISAGSDIVYQTIGSSPNRTTVVQWTNAVRTTAPGNFNFQIRLNEIDNSIELVYGSCVPTTTTNVTVQVGLRGLNNSFPQGNVLNRLQGASQVWFGNSSNGVANSSTMFSRDTAYPDLGLVYKYIPPPPCLTPTAQPTGFLIGSTSITQNSFVGNLFNPASPSPTNYLVVRSITNVAPTSAQVPNRTYFAVGQVFSGFTVVSNTSATTFTQTGLTADTTYYYWVIPFNDLCTGAPYYNLTGIISSSATTCSPVPVAATATLIGGNNFNANWSVVPSATNYFLDVSTDNTFTALVSGYSNLSVGNVNTFTVSGLSSQTTYYYRVRATGVGCIINSNTITVATICGYYNIPYNENFDTTPVGSVPACYVRDNANADPFQWQTSTINVASAPRSIFITKNTTANMNDWFFPPGLNLVGGVSYRLFFRYNTGNNAAFNENLKVRLGTAATSAAMTETLIDLPNINNSIYSSETVDFIPVTSGVYFIGFQGYSLANQSYIVIDDISVNISPTCFEPSDINISTVATTTASVSWTPSFPAPLNGYQYYVSQSSTAPINTTVATGSVGAGVTNVNLTGLLASTTYYIWVRGNCGTTDKSIWSIVESFSTECATPVILSSTPVTRCGIGTVTLNATSSTGSQINWFNSLTSSSILATGTSFTTPSLSATTTYYAEAKSFGTIDRVGPTTPVVQGGTFITQNFQSAVNFSIISNTSLLSIDIYPNVSGQAGQLKLRNSSNVTLATFNFTTLFAGGNTAQVIPINYTLLPGNYNLYFEIVPTSGIKMNNNNATYPYISSVANITGNSIDNTFYLGFYNWKFTTECLSTRVPVTATVTSPPALSISLANTIICSGDTTPVVMVSGYGSYSSLVWTPNTGISGSFATGFTFNPTVTTTYVLTANQTSGLLCGNVITHTVTVKPLPPGVSVVPNAATVCQNTIQPLNGSTAATSAVTIYNANFNNTAPDWTVANTSIGGNTTASQWTLYPDNFNYSSAFWNVTFHSNDNSQFFMANSDSQSATPGILTRTTLTSPTLNLAGYTSATLSYWQYLRFTLDVVLVEISTNGGSTWTTIKNYNTTQGGAASFSNDSINLNSYLGQTNVKIRFNFTSNWGYVWAIDNLTVSGTLAAALTWSPVTDLYQDASATIPYVLNTPLSVVYSKPTSTITYTAQLTGANSCFTTNTTTLTVTPQTVAGLVSSDQILCVGTAIAPLTLTGNTGNILRWEYADDATFTTNLTSIANTTTTLPTAQMGVITNTRYFRAVVKNGICNQLYTNTVLVSFPSTTWNGTSWSSGLPDSSKRLIFNGNFSSTSDLSACSVLVQSGNIVINSNHTLSILNDLNVSGGTVTFENNASLLQVNSATNTGNITFKRNTTPMKLYDYTYWSSPVSPQTLVSLSPNTPSDKYYYFSPIVGNWVGIGSNNLMSAGVGYIIRAPSSFDPSTATIFNSSFYGIPNNGNYTTPINVSTSIFNLIGNPYPSALNADAFLSFPSNVPIVDATIYLWTHNTPINANQYTSNDYAAYNYLGGVGTSSAFNSGINNAIPLGKVASGQSFFIKGLATGNVTFNNAMRITGNNSQFFRSQSVLNNPKATTTENNRFWLDVVDSNNAYKQTLIGYSEQATYANNDRGYDGQYVDAGNSVSIYSVVKDEKLTIQGRPLPFENTDIVPIGFKATTQGVNTISLYDYDGLFLNQDIYIKDNALNIIHDIKQSSYSFISDAGVFDSRFQIVYQSNVLNNNTFITNNSIILYKNSLKEIVVQSNETAIKEIVVYDMLGRVIYTNNNINNLIAKIELSANDVYLFQIKTIDDKLITKKYIN